MVSVYMKGQSSLTCKTNFNIWIKLKYLRYQNVVKYHHWKILFVGIGILGLCWLGFKSMEFDKNLMDIWIYNSSRLHNETSFISSKSGDQMDLGSIETILQVSDNDLLSTEYLLEHLQLMRHVVNVSLRYDGKVFSFSHFCQKVPFPRIHCLNREVATHIENIMPCRIITPLNCFWEGSKLFDQDSRINIPRNDMYSPFVRFDWKTLNISAKLLQSFENEFLHQLIADIIQEASIGSGYISKPCIDITDPFCPTKKQKNLDFPSIVNEGCYQIAENLFKNSKSIILGNENHGLQSLLLLRSSSDISNTMRFNEPDWTESKMQHIINLWLNEVRKTVVKYNKHRPYLSSLRYRNHQFQNQRIRKSSFYVFTNNSLNTVFNQAGQDKALLPKYLMSAGAVVLFEVTIFASSRNLVRSHCWLAICGGLLLIAAIISGLGLVAAAGMGFSALTTQVIPFLMIGLGLDEVVILTNRYLKSLDQVPTKRNSHHPVAQALYECATLLMVSFLIKLLILSVSTLIPIPMMRTFCIQVLFIIVLQTAVNVLLYPCLLHLDSVRRKSNRIDLLCCLLKRQTPPEDPESVPRPSPPSRQFECASSSRDLSRSRVIFSTEFTTSPHTLIPNDVHQYCEINPIDICKTVKSPTPKSSSHRKNDVGTFDIKVMKNKKHRCCWKFRYRISKTFFHIIVLVPFQITVILITVLIIVMGLYSAVNADCGLILESIFARDSNEYNYVKYEYQTFHIQTFYVVTKELDYVYNQDSVVQLHHAIAELQGVEMLENGKFWLSSFVAWLKRIQTDFDRDVKEQLIFLNGTWSPNASNNSLLAMSLMVQDGESINYAKLQTSRLVRDEKIDHESFYLLLNAWRSFSVDFDSLPCLLFPKLPPFNLYNFIAGPDRQHPEVIRMSGLHLFPSNPLQYVSCKYLYKGQSQKDDLVFVETVRSITLKFTDQGVPAIPLGTSFSLAEHYLKVRYQLMTVSIIVTIGMFLISIISINHFLVSFLATILLSSSFFSPVLLMNLYQIPLNATSGVMVLWSGGLGFRFSLFLIVSYVEQSEVPLNTKTSSLSTSSANRCGESCSSYMKLVLGKTKQTQLKRAFNDVQCSKAEFSSFIGMAFILMTDINFLWQHFLLFPVVGLLHSMVNYYCLAPILCLYLVRQSKTQNYGLPAPKSSTHRPNPRPLHRPENTSSKSCRSHSARTSTRNENDDGSSSVHGKLSIIPEESSSVLSSARSTVSREHKNAANDSSSSSSQSQETHQHFMKQNVESSVVIHYPSSSRSSDASSSSVAPELAIKTSFKYRQPLSTDD